ncbi:MAG TPA: DnaD domain protein [Candidatus Izemoplasmatales bacterium]|nr:DnaD domain protein [Bacillota bacterium]HRY77211.1 DnaD domain protein [Candidatus Izemoplasmatales bacterium]
MDYRLAKKWIDEGIIDFKELILQNYKDIGLNETEAFILIELHKQSKAGVKYLNPKKLIKNVALPMEELLGVLDRLLQNGFLSMEIVKTEAGKEAEVFSLGQTVEKIIKHSNRVLDELTLESPKTYATSEEELVDLIEKQFQKQLTPLEIEIIRKWVGEDRYSIFDIKKALLDAIKANKSSLSYVDGILLKRAHAVQKGKETQYAAQEPEALKAFFDSWIKK